MEDGMSKRSVLLVVTIVVSFFSLVPDVLWPLDPERVMSQYTLDKWSEIQGLPQNSIYSVLQTKDGYLWIGTQEGLARFDGVTFSLFNKDNTPELTSNQIKCMYEDSKDDLWIGTLNGGILLYRDGVFSTIPVLENLSGKAVYVILEISNGIFWIGTDGNGVYRYDRGAGTLTNYTSANGLPTDTIKSIFEDSKGRIWLGAIGGFCLYDKKTHGFTVFYISFDDNGNPITGEKMNKEAVNTIFEDSKGNLWIGATNDLFRMEDKKLISYQSRIHVNDEKLYVSNILEDRDKNLWIATRYSGLVRYKDGNFSFLGKDHGLEQNYVMALCEDNEGNLWLGGSYTGLFRLKDNKFTVTGAKEGLPSDIVWTIYEDSAGGLWFGTNGGITRFKDGRIKTLTQQNGLSHNTVDTILEDSKGSLWVGTDEGLNRLPNLDANRFRLDKALEDLIDGYIPSIMEDSAGNVWIGMLTGAYKFKDNNLIKYDDTNGLATRFVAFMHEDRQGHLWFSTLRGGLTVMRGDKFTFYTTKDGLISDNINCIFESKDGIMWFGSSNGLNRFKSGMFSAVTKENGLFNNNIYQILEDNSGYLWMSSNKGIFKVLKTELEAVADGKTNSLKSISYGRDDGMLNVECNGGYRGAGIRTKDGRLWFPTTKGAVAIHPDKIYTNKIPPPVHIEKILLDGKPADLNKPITVLPGVKQLEIHYTGLSFVLPERVTFKYKLEGFDEDWLNVGTRRAAWYTNLDGGQYQFKVIACNNDGIWNTTGESIDIKVIPPFWLTWWFISLALIAFAFFSYGVITLIRKYVSLSSFWKKQKHVGKFKLMDKIGSGGMGTVYKASNLLNKTETVALKILRDDLFEDENNRKRFKQEAAIIDQLDHPNIVRVFERGQSGQNMFIAMELLEGRTLAHKIQTERKIDLKVALHIMLQTASALNKIHARHIIHRDMKPENIMLIEKDDDKHFVKLLDFGLAKMENQTRLTQTGIVIGTINYMAPEQISGKGSFAASDVYSLGVIFYEMVTGEKPFPGESTVDIMKQILDKSAIEPSRFREDLPFDLNYLIMHMLVKDWESRPAIGDVLDRLKIVAMNIQAVTAPLSTKQ